MIRWRQFNRRSNRLNGLPRYLGALIPVVLVLLIRFLFWRFFGQHSPLPLLALGVMVAAWYGGWGPGLLATVIGAALGKFFLIKPIGSFQIADPADAAELGFFIVTGIGVSFFAARLRAAKQHAEDASRQKAEILESIQDGFLGVDRELRVSYANPAAEALLEKPRQEFIGKRFNEVCLEAPSPTAMGGCERALAERKLARFECFNPEVRKWFDFSAYPSRNGFAIYFRDVSGRKQDERALSRLAAIVDSSDDAIMSVNPRGEVTTWNAAAERIYGYSFEEIKGRTIKLLVPPGSEIESAWIDERIYRGESLQHFETRRLRKDGKLIDVSMTISPIRDSHGAVIGFSGIVRDITERKALEEQLRQAAKLESIGVLAGGIAHDFNNLLAGILGNASLASDTLPAGSPALPMLDDVIAASDRAANLTRQLLAYSGRGKFVIEAVDISRLTRDVNRLVQASIPKSVDVKFELAAGLPPVIADLAQMQQLIMNLVINAAEAIGDAPGVVTIKTGVQEVEEQRAGADQPAPGRYVFLEVRDTGCGMDEATIAKIFDPFFTTKFTGRGLGLSAALGIVKGHKGHIHVESSPGRGSRFRVLLPAAERKAEPSAAREASPELAGSGLILVVDDEEIVRHTAALALERRGYTILEASNGQEAIEIFRRRSGEIVLVLLDLSMPFMSGEECLRRLKNIKPDVPVLLSSGFSELEAERRFQASGIAGFLQKPYPPSRLAELVKAALAGVVWQKSA